MKFILPLVLVVGAMAVSHGQLAAQGTPVMQSGGSDVGKVMVGVIGDGYSNADLANGRFATDVKKLIVDGLFGDDVFKTHAKSFSVYRLDVASNQSGISTPTTQRDTALGMIFNGLFRRCWIEERPGLTEDRLRTHLGDTSYDYVVVIINNGDTRGGCHPGGNRLYITNNVAPSLVTHEFGHMVGSLFDEYVPNALPQGFNPGSVNYNNCSTASNPLLVPWSSEFTVGIGFPTQPLAPTASTEDTRVGMFEGCRYTKQGAFRPMSTCRMKDPHRPIKFCDVCRRILNTTLSRLIEGKIAQVGTAPVTAYLKMELNISDGLSEITRLTRIESPEGIVPALSATSSFAVEFLGGGQQLFAGTLGQDPFEVRAFPDPDYSEGEILPRKENVRIVVNVPITALTNLSTDKLQLNLFRYKIDKLSNPGNLPLDINKLNQLKKENLLQKKFQIKPESFKSIKMVN